MSWKPKEKDLTAPEALEFARRELAPFWFGSSPQIVGIRDGNHCLVVPLDSNFIKKTWILFFLDLTSFSGEQILIYAKEWSRRYSPYRVFSLGILIPTYDFFKNEQVVQKLIEDQHVNFAVMVDFEKAVASSFNALIPPRIILFHLGEVKLNYFKYEEFGSAELDIQKFLRSMDPGLPLLRVFEINENTLQKSTGRKVSKIIKDTRKVEFGSQAFHLNQVVSSSSTLIKKLKKDEIVVLGQWGQDLEKIVPKNQHAMIQIQCSSSFFSIVANVQSKNQDLPKISVEVDGMPPYDAIIGESLVRDELGFTIIRVNSAKLYHVLINLPEGDHEITLRFPNGDSASVGLYGLRFGDPV